MEKPAEKASKVQENSKQQQQQPQQQQRVVWDCGSSLYDSFELKTFKRQLDSAIISSRTNSMPRLSNRAPISQTAEKTSSTVSPTTKKSKIKSLQKFLRSVFHPRHVNSSHAENKHSDKDSHGFDDVDYDINLLPYDEFLTPIPELDMEISNSKDPQPEYYDDSAVVRKTVSERFMKMSMVGISCV